MTREEAESFARQWADAWNAGALEQVLSHFHDDIVFTSPTALDMVGTATIRGKPALSAYWTAALARIGAVNFTVDRVLWDPATRELAILYTSRFAGKSKRVSENLVFDADGVIVSAEVLHGAAGQ